MGLVSTRVACSLPGCLSHQWSPVSRRQRVRASRSRASEASDLCVSFEGIEFLFLFCFVILLFLKWELHTTD